MEVALLAGDYSWDNVSVHGEFTSWVQVDKETVDLLETFVNEFSGSEVVGGQSLYLLKRVPIVKDPMTLVRIKELVDERLEERKARQEAIRQRTAAQQASKAAKAQQKAARKAREQLQLILETVNPEEKAELLARLQSTGS